jgi:hypothetical protein
VVDTDLWLSSFGQRSGCVDPFKGDGAEIAAVGVAAFGVVAGQPPEDLAAAAGRITPAATVLEDFAFEGGVERFAQRIVSARTDTAHGLSDTKIRAEFREIL